MGVDGCVGTVILGELDPSIQQRARDIGRALALRSREEATMFFVPGRLELLGKHTDYAGGRSLTCATERGLCVGATGRSDRRLAIIDLARRVSATLDLSDSSALCGFDDWRRYPAAVARRLTSDFEGEWKGKEVAMAGNLPPAAGLSSSSSLIVAFFLALAWADERLAEDFCGDGGTLRLAGYLGAIESGAGYPLSGRSARAPTAAAGVGTFGGSQDHTAILCSSRQELGRYSYDPVVGEQTVELPEDLCFCVAVSGVHASKAGAARRAFNRLSDLASAAAEIWRMESSEDHPHLGAAVRAAGAETVRSAIEQGRHPDYQTVELLERFDHFVEESETLVPEAIAAMLAHDFDRFGELVQRSQCLGQERLHNQVPETVFLARAARQLGALAASAFGAGFGGSVWALTAVQGAERFVERWRTAYSQDFSFHSAATFFVTRPSGGARRIVDCS